MRLGPATIVRLKSAFRHSCLFSTQKKRVRLTAQAVSVKKAEHNSALSVNFWSQERRPFQAEVCLDYCLARLGRESFGPAGKVRPDALYLEDLYFRSPSKVKDIIAGPKGRLLMMALPSSETGEISVLKPFNAPLTCRNQAKTKTLREGHYRKTKIISKACGFLLLINPHYVSLRPVSDLKYPCK